jgi:hypothetical protein
VKPSKYAVQRDFFQSYRGLIWSNESVRVEVSSSIASVLQRYNTVVWENRFIVGGVVEQVIGASARALGIEIRNAGKQNQGYDLELNDEDHSGVSIKAVFASTKGKHNLVNTRSQNLGGVDPSRWQSATIFVMAGVGMGYIDPEFGSNLVTSTSDAIQISGKGLQDWWGLNPEWLIPIEIPNKPTGEASRVASDAVSFDVFQDFQTLKKFWEPEI